MLLDFKLSYDIYVESVDHIIRASEHLIVFVVDVGVEFLFDFLHRFLLSKVIVQIFHLQEIVVIVHFLCHLDIFIIDRGLRP